MRWKPLQNVVFELLGTIYALGFVYMSNTILLSRILIINSDNKSGSIRLFHCDCQGFPNTRLPPLPCNIIPLLQVARLNLSEVKLHQLSWSSTLLPILGPRCIPASVAQISAREPDPDLGFGIFGYRHRSPGLVLILYILTSSLCIYTYIPLNTEHIFVRKLGSFTSDGCEFGLRLIDGVSRLWDSRSGKLLHRYHQHNRYGQRKRGILTTKAESNTSRGPSSI